MNHLGLTYLKIVVRQP